MAASSGSRTSPPVPFLPLPPSWWRRKRHLRMLWETPGLPGEGNRAVGGWHLPGTAVRGTLDGLRAVDTATGRPAWDWTVPGRGLLLAMTDRVQDGVGLALHGEEGEYGTVRQVTATAFAAASGEPLWSQRRDFADGFPHDTAAAARTVLVRPGSALVLTDRHLAAHDLRTGRQLWTAPHERHDRHDRYERTGALAAAGSESVVCVTTYRGRATVRRLNAATGTVHRTFEVPSGGHLASVRIAHQDPLVLALQDGGRRGIDNGLIALDAEGQVTARIPHTGEYGELWYDREQTGIAADLPVAVTGGTLVVPTREVGGSWTHLTGFSLDGGRTRWTWKSEETLTGLALSGGHVLALSKWLAPTGEADHPVHLHVLDAATGRPVAVRRLPGYQAGTAGRLHLETGRLIRINHFGDSIWHPVQAFGLR